MASITITVNGIAFDIASEPDTPLLPVLRNDCGLNGVRYGCGLEQCGACKVLINGEPQFACTYPLAAAAGKEITTVEGLGQPDRLHPLQMAFLEYNAAQCGYCSAGILIAAAALLAVNADPSREEIQQALAGHLCRCGAHNRVIKAVTRAAEMIRAGSPT